MLRLFVNWRRRVLLKRLAEYIEYGVEYESADYFRGHCKGKPLRVWCKQESELVEQAGCKRLGRPKFHLDIWRNRILVDNLGFLSGRSYAIYPFGITRIIAMS